jgi:uncharacterized metal-binding protein
MLNGPSSSLNSRQSINENFKSTFFFNYRRQAMNPLQSSGGCSCSAGPKLIFSSSGAVDVGELTDRTARKLTHDGSGKMFCMAGIGGRVSGILKSTEAAASILAIDGFTKINHLRLTDLGFEKGNTDVNSDSIAQVVDKAKTFLS